MNYLVIGGVAGGATVAARLRRMDEKANNPKCLHPDSKEILERNADMLAEELPPDTWNRNYQKGSEQV